MRLTPNFTLAELTRSSTAERLGLSNKPDDSTVQRLKETAHMLQRIRDHLGKPVVVTSGYRSLAVNKAVGGVTSSDHVRGMAADIVVPAYGPPYKVAKALAPLVDALGIGQLILEGIGGKQWLHCSTRVPDRAANRVITITDAGAQFGIQKIA